MLAMRRFSPDLSLSDAPARSKRHRDAAYDLRPGSLCIFGSGDQRGISLGFFELTSRTWITIGSVFSRSGTGTIYLAIGWAVLPNRND